MQSVHGFFDMICQFINGNVFYALAGISFFLLLYFCGKKERNIAITAALLLLVLVYNPVSYQIIGVKMDYVKTYYRFLWLFPAASLLAYLVYKIILKFCDKKYRMVFVCMVCAGVLFFHVAPEELKLPDNAWQIPDETLEVAEQLKTLMREKNESNAVILCDLYIGNTIRQYDSGFCFPFKHFGFYELEADLDEETVHGLMSMLMYNRNDISKDAVGKIIQENQIEYLVINAVNDVSLAYMEEMGWQIVSSTSSYHILSKPEFSIEPLIENDMNLEEVVVTVPEMTEEYHFLFLSDLHIIVEDESISKEEKETVSSRMSLFKTSDGKPAADYWIELAEVLNSCNADAILLGGDMVDFCSRSNIASLQEGLDQLSTPYIYVRADHDYKPYYCNEITEEECERLHAGLDGDEEVWVMELPEVCVVGLGNSTSSLSETALDSMKKVFSDGKPIILLTHVPYASEVSASLEEASKEAWAGRSLLWGREESYYKLDENVTEFLNMIYAKDSPVKEIVSGHLHFTWDGDITESTRQHVFSPAFQKIGVITVKGAE